MLSIFMLSAVQFQGSMQLFDDGDPESSWRNCPAKWCLQLYEGKLWKCPAIAYLEMQDRKHGLGEAWQPYLEYEALGSDCSDAELREFVERRAERVCGMCPARVERIKIDSAVRVPDASESRKLAGTEMMWTGRTG